MLRHVRRLGKRRLLVASSTGERYKQTNAAESLDSLQALEAIRQLYKDAIQLTGGRPSAALLEALSQQSRLEGVDVSGEEIHALKFEARQQKAKSSLLPLPKIKQSTPSALVILESYLDICLTKGKLSEFANLLNRAPQFPPSTINQSILLRYALSCSRAEVTPKVTLSSEIKEIMQLIDQCRKDEFSDVASQKEKITQEFVNSILRNFSFYPSDFAEFKTAALIANPSLNFRLSNNHLPREELEELYPIIGQLLDLPADPKFSYPKIPALSYRVALQLENEKREFTQLLSISETGKEEAPELFRHKEKLQMQWEDALHAALVRESRLYRLGDYEDFRRKNCPYLDENVVSLREIAKQTVNYLSEVLVNQYEGIGVNKVASSLGNMVFKKYRQRFLEFPVDQYSAYMSSLQDLPGHEPQSVWAMHGSGPSSSVNKGSVEFQQFTPQWTSGTLSSLGGFLLNLVLDCCTFDRDSCRAVLGKGAVADTEEDGSRTPVFTHTYLISKTMEHNYPIGTFVANPLIKELVLRISRNRGYFYFPSHEVPMLCPPRPWTYASRTPMLLNDISFIRYAGRDWEAYFENMLASYDLKGHIEVVKYGLDVLGSLPWTINQKVLQKQIDVYNGGGLSKLAIAETFKKEYPPQPNAATATEAESQWYKSEVKKLKKEEDERFSLRSTQLYTLSHARYLASKGLFWQCYNQDFRGRVYPVAPHLSQMLGDPARGTLLFGHGAPLGEEGFRWLKIHCINKFGAIRKGTFEEKEQYADEMMGKIIDSADHMDTEKGWWAQSTEDPWQCLASCIEIAAAVRSGDPTSYVTQLPVHMDGSCNGLQHYAALGRDLEGAIKVNVAPSSHPQDVYLAVLDIVVRMGRKDAERGSPVAQLLQGKLERKTLKQTIMTQVYGVTLYGGSEQIKGKLIDRGVDPVDAGKCAMYLSKCTFKAVGELFTQAQQIQGWLNTAAYDIASTGAPVSWVTPLGLPCVQPYTKAKQHVVETPVQDISSTVASPTMAVNRRKQRTAFPPNFVHSLDSTHMMMTAIKCYQVGIPFAAVHDSFWTLPCHVARMNTILREQFALMYSYDVLKNLKESFEKSFPEVKLSELPESGALDIESVKDSEYFFS